MKHFMRVRDKPTIDYGKSDAQMGDLLMGCGDPISKLSPRRKKKLCRRLEKYMPSKEASKPITLDLGTCYLTIKGADEAGDLYYLLQ